MKISKIEIVDYLQFQRFTLDLTYPKGHEKEGKPLDKVCFIGQSGTGKTTLLNLIRALSSLGLADMDYVHPSMKSIGAVFHSVYGKDWRVSISQGRLVASFYEDHAVRLKAVQKYVIQHYTDKNVLLYFPSEINVNLGRVFQTTYKAGLDFGSKDTHHVSETSASYIREINKEPVSQKQEMAERSTFLEPGKLRFLDFGYQNIQELWELVLDNVQRHIVSRLSFSNSITNQMQANPHNIENFIDQFQQWQKKNPNPLEELANKLNPLLNKFNLEIRPEIKFETADDLKFIKIHNLQGEEVPNFAWSTGTKQFVMTTTPLFQLDTEQSIVLIDEPERSFYPDIQQEIVGFYSQLAPNAQFFYATHSPLVASSFDPWEIIELKYDDKGHIVQDHLYDTTKERHIDNFKLSPKYLRWDSILSRIFDIENDGQPERQEKLRQLAELDVRLRKLRSNGSDHKAEIDALWTKFKETAALLDWALPAKYEKN